MVKKTFVNNEAYKKRSYIDKRVVNNIRFKEVY